MTPTLDTIHQGDVRQVLAGWPEGIVQTVVTSPPYWGLRDYGVAGQLGLEETPESYVAAMVEVFREVRRLLRPDGTLWLNLGDCYIDAGGAGRQGTNGQRADRRHTQASLKRRKTVSHLEGHTGTQDYALRADEAGRFAPGLKPKDLAGIPWRVAFALQADGWYLRSDIIWAKKNCMPESVQDRPTRNHEYIFLLSKSPRYFYDAEAIKEPCSESFLNDARHERGSLPNPEREAYLAAGAQDPKGPHRLFGKKWKTPAVWDTGPGAHTKKVGNYSSKKRNPRPGIDSRGGGQGSGEMHYPTDRRNKRTVWTVATTPFAEAHFATFPQKLIEPCILAGSRQGDTVLDPFMGAGTTALVAARLNRRFLGVELNPDYVKIAERRIACEVQQVKMAI